MLPNPRVELPNNPPPVVLPNRLVPVPVPNVVPNAGLFCVPNRPPVLVVPNVPSVPDEKIKYKYAIDGSNEDGSGRWQLKVLGLQCRQGRHHESGHQSP